MRYFIQALLLGAATNCGGLTTSARGSVQSCMLRQARSRLPLLRARGSSAERASFEISVDLGEGSGIVDGDLPALFTRSELLTVRYPLPFALEAEPMQGVVKVVEAGNGLQVGVTIPRKSVCATARAIAAPWRRRLAPRRPGAPRIGWERSSNGPPQSSGALRRHGRPRCCSSLTVGRTSK